MTAEIAVLNGAGVALAADSAVTVSREASKIYLSADKLFQFSLNAPVAAMIYGNATLLGVPWETIIKCYRAKLGQRTFARLEDYQRDFVRFLKSDKKMFPARLQAEDIEISIVGFYAHIRNEFMKNVAEAHAQGQQLTAIQNKRMFTSLVKDELEKSKKWPSLDEMSPKRIQEMRKRYTRTIRKCRADIFEELPISQDTGRRLVDLAMEVLTRRRLLQGGTSSGVVIAGFGDEEHFPRLIRMQVLGIAIDLPLYFVEGHVAVETGREAVVVPLAQKEMVETFMEGIDPKLREMIETSTGRLFTQMSSIIIDELKAKHPKEAVALKRKVSAGLDALLAALYTEWTSFRRKGYTSPVMQMVASLPKDELGAMAESLVNLTRFKRRISNEQETVGGPIDVAVITKGDGFVWTKRKHYFAPELNPRYMARVIGR